MTNLVFLDTRITKSDELMTYFNTNSELILYNEHTTYEEITSKVQALEKSSFEYLCFVFADDHSGNMKFIGEDNFISKGENGEIVSNRVFEMIQSLVSTYGINKIDFLACNLLIYPSWTEYFQYLISNLTSTGTISVRASNDNTGNLKSGGDWVLESTNEDVKMLYFTEDVEEWAGLLDHSSRMNGLLLKNATTNEVDYYAFGTNSTFGELGTVLTTKSYRESIFYNNSGLTLKTTGNWLDSKLSFGLGFGAMITSDDKLYTWGYNENYELGTGDRLASQSPRLILDGSVINKTFKKVVCSRDFSYLLTDDGKIYCWGNNQLGQSAGLANTTTPQLMTGGIFNGTIDDICIGTYSAACITNNKVYAWGQNRKLQVPGRDASGNLITTSHGTTTVYTTPVEVLGIPDTPLRLFGHWAFIASDGAFASGIACLTSNNEIWIWGWNAYYAFGIGDAQAPNPVKLTYSSGKIPVALFFGTSFTITLMTDGTIFGAGKNSSNSDGDNNYVLGNLGGTVFNQTLITQVLTGWTNSTWRVLPPITKVNLFASRGILIGNDGNLYHLSNTSGVINWSDSHNPPSKVITDIGNRNVHMAWINSYGNASGSILLTTDNKMYYAGYSDFGETLSTGIQRQHTPIKLNPRDQANLDNPGDVIEFRVNENFHTVLTTNNHLYSMGSNGSGNFGNGNTTSSSTWVRAGGPLLNKTITKHILGRFYVAVLTSDNLCYMYGNNGFFGLGLSSSSASVSTPTLLTISGETIVDVGCGYGHSIFVCASGKVYSVGRNDLGQLGIGTSGSATSSSSTDFQPKEITYFTTNNIQIKKVMCGSYYSIAIDSSGRLFGWGTNSNGQIGDNSTTQRNTPVLVSTNISGKVITRIECGDASTMALTSSGEVFTWGYRSSYTRSGTENVPNIVNLSGEAATWIRAVSNQYFIITETNKLFIAGDATEGQLGNRRLANITTLTEYDMPNLLPGVVALNQSLTNSSLSLTNNISTNLSASNLSGLTGTFPDFVKAASPLSISNYSYSGSVFQNASLGVSTMNSYLLSPINTTLSNYATLDFNFTWNSELRVYFYKQGDATPQTLTTTVNNDYYYSTPNSTTLRIHTKHTGYIGFYNFIDIPGAPTNIVAIPGPNSATVRFLPPLNNGGATIDSYTVVASPGGIDAIGSSSPITVSGLTKNTSYTFTVYATNVAGNSANSAVSNTIITAVEPNPPTNVSAVAGNTIATVSFSAPVFTGRTPITSYTVVSSPGDITTTGTASPIIVRGLTNNTAYTFTIKATNGVGDSSFSSASSSITPVSQTLTVGETNTKTETLLTGLRNTTGTKLQKKEVVRTLINSDKTNRFVSTTLGEIETLINQSLFYIRTQGSKPVSMVLLDDSETTSESPLTVDVSTIISNNEIVYIPGKGGERVNITIDGTTYNLLFNAVDGEVVSVTVNNTTTLTNVGEIYDKFRLVVLGSIGVQSVDAPFESGGGSDPYITNIYGEIYELPELTKWWNLLTDDKMSIMAHTQNYPGGNFFNQVVVNYQNQKVIIDFNKRKIINKSSLENIKVGKVPYKFKFKNELGEIESEKDYADCVQIKDSEYKEILILVDWKNHYIVPKFGRIPNKKISGLFVNKPVSVKKYIK